MNVAQLIGRKRDGAELSGDEIRAFLGGYTRGEIPDYQVSALLMAVFFRGMSDAELDAWTDAMIRSGVTLDLSALPGPKIDKHSTGGVGDKVSLPLAPIAAACGVRVPMISGRGLGHTGGTLDKLESIPGMDVKVDKARFLRVLDDTGLVFAGQTADICPADRKLYALRDVTGTVESIPLISSSIMSKKLAEGIDGLVLDIKVGSGAFMKDLERARLLARTMIRIGTGRGIKVKAVLTRMEQPLGLACGNGVETAEGIEVLHGRGPEDLREAVLHLTAWMLVLGGVRGDVEGAKALCLEKIRGGEALDRMRRVVAAQGGDARVVDDPGLLPAGKHRATLAAPESGWVARIDAFTIGMACIDLGAGRARAEDGVDPGAGMLLAAKVGARVEKGAPLATLMSGDGARLAPALARAAGAYAISPSPVAPEGSLIIEEL